MVDAVSLPAEVRALYPWEGQTLQLGDHALHYLDEGQGEPLLMVHGNPTWSFYYRNVVKAFSDRYRCVVPDHMGCGLSDKPQDYSYTLATHIDNLVRLIEHLDLKDITLVVHDWGGAIGFGAALRVPERIKRLVVFNTAVFEGPLPASIKMCRVPLLGSTVVRGLNGFLRAGLLRATSDRSRMSGAVGQGYLAPYTSWQDRIVIHRFVQDIPLEEGHPTRALFLGIGDRLGVLKDRPMLLIWGEQDFCFTPFYRKEWEKRFPHAEVHALEDAAHWVVEDAIDRIVPWLNDFLERHP